MAYIKADIQVWRGNTGIVGNDFGFVVRVLDSNNAPVVPLSARFKTKCGTIDKDSLTGDVLVNQDMTVEGVVQTGYTVVPFSAAETRALNSSKYELEYVNGDSQRTEFYGSIKATGRHNND